MVSKMSQLGLLSYKNPSLLCPASSIEKMVRTTIRHLSSTGSSQHVTSSDGMNARQPEQPLSNDSNPSPEQINQLSQLSSDERRLALQEALLAARDRRLSPSQALRFGLGMVGMQRKDPGTPGAII